MLALIDKRLLLVLFLLASCTGSSVKDSSLYVQHSDSLFGTWTVMKYAFGNSVSAFDNESDAARYINEKIILTPNMAEIFGDKCSKPSYQITRNYTKDLFFNEFGESDSSIIPRLDSVTVDIVSCMSAPEASNPDSLNFVYYLVYLNSREMIAHINGAYFFLSKQ